MIGAMPRQRVIGAAAGLLLTAACGGTTPASPSTPPVTATTTITITSSGVSPKTVEIAIGSRVRFVNNDAFSHSIVSDPHPDNNECPEINQVGFLQTGQTRETGNFVEAHICGFHDYTTPFVTEWQGTITIK
jgi:plastocyanin